MSFEVVGKLYKKFPTESKSEKFQIRELVIELLDGNYTQLIKFQLTQDRCQLLDNYEEGEQIKVHFDLQGREWQGKYFSTLNCWRLEKSDGQAAAATAKPKANPQAAAKASMTMPSADDFPSLADEPFKTAADDDLPF